MSVNDIDLEVVSRDDRSKFWSNLPATFETKHRRKDGTTFPVEIRLGPIEYGETKVVLAVVRNITDRKALEEELRASEERFRKVFEQGPLGVAIIDLDYRFVSVNTKLCDLLGYTEDELIKLTFADITHPEDVKTDLEQLERLLQGDIPYHKMTKRYVTKLGKVLWANLTGTLIRGERGEPLYLLGMVEDITGRKASEQALQESEEKYRLLHETMTDAFVSMDLSGRILETNRAYQIMLGYSEQELGNLTYLDLTPKKWHALETKIVQEQILVRGYSDVYCKEYRKKDGSVFPVELRTFLIRDSAGSPSLMWAIVRDITERTNAEEQIKASLREKEILLREIHHRVKNNMAVIQSLLRIQSRYAKSAEFNQMLEDAQNRIRSLILAHELLYQSEHLTEVNFRKYVGKLLSHLVSSFSAIGKGIKIRSEIQDIVLGIDTAIPMGFIITELVSNCLKHAFPADRRGEVSVSFRSVGDGEFEFNVRDDGVGMPTDIDAENPSSIGLDLVRIFVGLLNGTMQVSRDKGTDVRIRFRER
jgi:PAS domain S-box-containing protein